MSLWDTRKHSSLPFWPLGMAGWKACPTTLGMLPLVRRGTIENPRKVYSGTEALSKYHRIVNLAAFPFPFYPRAIA